MAKYCTTCGAELDESYKFCPECGADINHKENNESQRGDEQIVSEGSGVSDVIICDNCGDENPAGENVCTGCGAALKGAVVKKTSSKEFKTIQSKTSEQRKHSVSKGKKKKHRQDQKSVVKKESKEFDAKKIYLIAFVIALFVFIVLFSSGAFDADESVVTNPNVGNNQSNNSGINLANLDKINDLEAKLNASPNDLDLLLELAHLKNDSGFFDNAIALYQRYLDKNPADADARIDMGVCYFNLRNYEAAIKEMKKALEYQPKHQIGHLNLGIVNLTAGNVEEAKEWFKKTIELGPDTEIGKRAKELLNSHTL